MDELSSTVSPEVDPLCVLNLPSEGKKKSNIHHVINILLIMTTSPFNSAKNLVGYIWIKRHIHTVYTLESVFNPRYRSENADAAIWGEKQNKTQV